MIMDLLKELNDLGTTIVQVTHNERWAGYGDRVIELEDGRVVEDYSTATAQI
jgi:ABC-type lipoprotein export system ATPase subunit